MIVFAGLTACSKKEVPSEAGSDLDVKPQKGMSAISGWIHPFFAFNSFTVTLINTETGRAFSTKPEASGQYKLTALPPGQYEIGLKIEDTTIPAVKLPMPFTAGKAEVFNLNFVGHPAIPLMKGTGKITGSISPAGQGARAVAYHTVTEQQYQADLDASGEFLIKDMPEGTYSVSV